ncbi:hypothetical protein LTR62_002732 [Meristemomyces frigidus]|uniref:Heterokaryon incompatibility domain-containing protein n=1 Tax=Meristemomyces frigidus TaxID=1508187 RepID=A0AAN7YS26_9PEZI|nr:hypothetical protein LTR62_002732 [Meristemomyces frigidus]
MRRAGFTASIWIDALCIDQNNEEEKRQQVAMMGEIFSTAREVIVWLGEAAHGVGTSPRSFEWVKDMKMHKSIEQCIRLLAQDAHFHDLPFTFHCMTRNCPSTQHPLQAHTHTWHEVLPILRIWFDCPWFDRTWTVQEIVLARHATLMLGPHTLSWNTVTDAFANLSKHMHGCCSECIFGLPGSEPEEVYTMISHVVDFVVAKRAMDRGQHLLQALLQFGGKKATEPRDKIYGLLGLQSCRRPTPVLADYSSSLQEVFTRVARDVVVSQGSLLTMCLDLRQEAKGLPSWVPDWSIVSTGPVVYTLSRFEWAKTYNAAKYLPAPVLAEIDDELMVDGIRVDTITELGSAYEMTKDIGDQLAVVRTWREMIGLSTNSKTPYIADGNLEEAFWRTMFGNRFQLRNHSRPVERDDIDVLQVYIREAERRHAVYGGDALITLNDAFSSHLTAVLDRRLFRTTKGWIGVCPKAAICGDHVFVLGDCSVPVVLQAVEAASGSEVKYRVLGHCYMQGIMEGEACGLGKAVQRVCIA